jgi:hypothetical protein
MALAAPGLNWHPPEPEEFQLQNPAKDGYVRYTKTIAYSAQYDKYIVTMKVEDFGAFNHRSSTEFMTVENARIDYLNKIDDGYEEPISA